MRSKSSKNFNHLLHPLASLGRSTCKEYYLEPCLNNHILSFFKCTLVVDVGAVELVRSFCDCVSFVCVKVG